MVTLKMISMEFGKIASYNKHMEVLQNYLHDLYEDIEIVKYELEQPERINELGKYKAKIKETENQIDQLEKMGLNQLYGEIYEKGSLEDRELLVNLTEDISKQTNYFESEISNYQFIEKGDEYQFTIQEICKFLVDNESPLIDVPLDKNSLKLLLDISKKIDIGTIISNSETETYLHEMDIGEEVAKFCKNQGNNKEKSFVALYEYFLQKTKECTNKIIMDMSYDGKLDDLTFELQTIANSIDKTDKKLEYLKNILTTVEELSKELEKYKMDNKEILILINEEKRHPFRNRGNLKNLYQKQDDIQVNINQIQNKLKLFGILPGVNQSCLIDSIQSIQIQKNGLLRDYADKKKEFFDVNICYARACSDIDILLTLRRNLLYSELCNISYDAGNHVDTINQLELIHGHNKTVINNLFTNLPIPENYGVSKIIFEKNNNLFPDNISVKVQYSNIGDHYIDSQTEIYEGKKVMDRTLLCFVDFYSEMLSPINCINHQIAKEAYSVILKIEEYVSEQNKIIQHIRGGVSLPEGWIWHHYDDCSGCLSSPEGIDYFSYDLATREAKYGCSKTSSWDAFDGTREQLVELAENWVKNRIIGNEIVEKQQEKDMKHETTIQEPITMTHTSRGR